jgi:hypothetical protein
VKHFSNCQWGVHAKMQMTNTLAGVQHAHMKAGGMFPGDQRWMPTPGLPDSECMPPISQTPLRPPSGSFSGSARKFTQHSEWDRDAASTVSDFSSDSNPPVSPPNSKFSGGSASPALRSLAMTPTMPTQRISQTSYESEDGQKVRALSLPSSPSVRWADASDDEE